MVSVPSIDVDFMNCSRSVFPCAGSTTPSLFEHERVAVKSSTTVYCVRATFGEKYLHTIYVKHDEVLKEHKTYSMWHLHVT